MQKLLTELRSLASDNGSRQLMCTSQYIQSFVGLYNPAAAGYTLSGHGSSGDHEAASDASELPLATLQAFGTGEDENSALTELVNLLLKYQELHSENVGLNPPSKKPATATAAAEPTDAATTPRNGQAEAEQAEPSQTKALLLPSLHSASSSAKELLIPSSPSSPPELPTSTPTVHIASVEADILPPTSDVVTASAGVSEVPSASVPSDPSATEIASDNALTMESLQGIEVKLVDGAPDGSSQQTILAADASESSKPTEDQQLPPLSQESLPFSPLLASSDSSTVPISSEPQVPLPGPSTTSLSAPTEIKEQPFNQEFICDKQTWMATLLIASVNEGNFSFRHHMTKRMFLLFSILQSIGVRLASQSNDLIPRLLQLIKQEFRNLKNKLASSSPDSSASIHETAFALQALCQTLAYLTRELGKQC